MYPRSHLRPIPSRRPGSMNRLKFRERSKVWSPTEIINDKALHAREYSSINKSYCVGDSCWSENIDDRILSEELCGEVFAVIVGFDDWKAFRGN